MSFIAAQKHYRPDIDGLRAVAVVAVVLFHAGVPGFSGGFVGVDVFFVISGYLITGILARGFAGGTFSLVEFYERRARRILPALFVMILGTLAIAPFLIRPWDLSAIGRSVKYVVTSVANLDFYKTLSNYSGDDASLAPLLHTWSLSVEEQFYILIPLIWLILSKFTRNHSHWLNLFVVFVVVSFALSVWMLSKDQSASFFLLPYRAWELGLGGVLALAPKPTLGHWPTRLLGFAGLGMILAATVIFDHETAFPGPWALLPCVGAALIILSGTGHATTLPTVILSSKPFVFIGLISYSLYLVHWPVLVFARYREQYSGSETEPWETALLLGVIFFGGWVSWRFVESPFRQSARWTRRRIFIFAWSGIFALFGLGAFYQKSPLFLNLLPEEARQIAEARFFTLSMPEDELPSKGGDEIDYFRCGTPGVEADTVVWGDSHAAALSLALHELAVAENRSFLIYGRNSTPPVKGIVCGEGFKSISRASYNEKVYEALTEDKSIRTVILAARWASYTEGNTSAYGPAEKPKKLRDPILRLPGNPGPGSQEVRSAFAEALEATVTGLIDSGKKVYLVYPVPEPAYFVPQVLANEVVEGRNPEDFIISAKGVYDERASAMITILDGLPDSEGLVRIRPEKLLIDDGRILLIRDGKPLYRDDDHLSLEGGRYIMSLFEQIF